MADQRIAIVGSACRFPGSSSSPEKLWKLLRQPRDLSAKISDQRFNVDAFYHENGQNHGTTNARQAYLLSEDIRAFDAPFFGISSSEADSIDPQQRMLLESVYESLDAAGLRLEDLRGSSTGVFCGVMCDDYGGLLYRDIDALPQYTATGTARSILSNRVSYCFDWKGPSMTIDTACSSSLVAVHMAAKALNDRECPVAVAAGVNLIISPNMFVSESNLNMLSPNGRSRMWDAAADGYARGEGIASVVLKRLEDALADGDPIECVIRATHVNQDGRSAGITMPSSEAQTRLIRRTYEKANLDLRKSSDRCQYFEAHGTGTPAGDPQEASAIAAAFFPDGSSTGDKLIVGSVKTVIGHTEGTAGLAGLLKASLALQHGLIPPNLHFNRLNPRLEPFYTNLQVPTKIREWPQLPPGAPRRASVNSFGFGGTNAHVILESFTPADRATTISRSPLALPLVFSAPSERALTSVLERYKAYLTEKPDLDLRDLAWSLFSRRSKFRFRVAIAAQSASDICNQLGAEIERRKGGQAAISSRASTKQILGIFTGQGAQWARMGYDLIQSSHAARDKFAELESALATLPPAHRPDFSLATELAKKEHSRLSEAALSQPLCTAVQLVLVDLLQAAGISFHAVVGHSSGEIAAAYAAGHINATEAIRIAYYRGFFAKLAGSSGKKGAMLAAGMDLDEARELCSRPEFEGRVKPAASNSSASVTLSGDADAIAEIEAVLKQEEKFARALKVDTAYHSHHMLPCSKPYIAALESCAIDPQPSNGCKWFSSVLDGDLIESLDPLKAEYWRDNMVNAVLFSQALSAAVGDASYDLIIEVGPHPALKGPALQVISDATTSDAPYTGVLKRGESDLNAFAAAIGTVWAHVGIDSPAAEGLMSQFDDYRPPIVMRNLPTYPYDRDRTYWAESRCSKALQRRKHPPNLLLGSLIPDAANEEWRWRNYLRPSEISWLEGHQIQSQMVFPATGYVAMALEAAKVIAAGRSLSMVEIDDFKIGRAIAFNDDWAGVETLFKIDKVSFDNSGAFALAHFGCYANHGGTLSLCAEGELTLSFGDSDSTTLAPQSSQGSDMMELDATGFYEYLKGLGYGYSGLFRGLFSLSRKQDASSGLVSNSCLQDPKPALMHHPALMDTLLQTLLAAVGCPGDGRLFSLHVPTSIEKITINPYFCGEACQGLGEYLAFDCNLTKYTPGGVRGDIDLFTANGESAVLQMEGVHVAPLMAPTPADDRLLFSETTWGPMYPNPAMFPETPCHEPLTGGVDSSPCRSALGGIASQLAFRFPRMKVLEVGTGSGDIAQEILHRIPDTYHSYTVTDVSTDVLENAKRRLSHISERLIFKPLDTTLAPGPQGYEEHRYDLVVASSIALDNAVLGHVRQLLKPGGYMMVSDVPLSDMSEWNTTLVQTEFSGIDTIVSGNRSDSEPLSVLVSQAVDSMINFIRQPVAMFEERERLNELVIIGGLTKFTSKLLEQIMRLLSPSFKQLRIARDFDSLDMTHSALTTVLCLAELDRPLFKGINERRLKSLQRLVEGTQNLLWVSAGAKSEKMYESMTPAVLRSVAYESPHMHYQYLQIHDPNDISAATIADALLRVAFVDTYNEISCSDLLWTTEPELYLEKGVWSIPRIQTSSQMNSRYMAARRIVTQNATPETAVSVVQREQVYDLEMLTSADLTDNILVEFSTLFAVKTRETDFVHLLYGKKPDGSSVVALSSQNGTSVTVPMHCCIDCVVSPNQAAQLLSAMSTFLAADYLTSLAEPDSNVLIHEADPMLQDAIATKCRLKNIRPYFTATHDDASLKDQICLHPRSSVRSLRASLPQNVSLFANMHTEGTTIASRLKEATNPVLLLDGKDVYATCSAAPPKSSHEIAELLHTAYIMGMSTSKERPYNVVSAANVPGAPLRTMSIVDWTQASELSVTVQTASTNITLQPHKTYLLVGMTGDLGRSVCKWMVSRGAKNIVLTSRKPAVDPEWILQMATLGARVEVFAMDVTDKSSVRDTDNLIRESLPPVGGVINGAMVMRDVLFTDMPFDAWEATMRPKVDGSLNLSDQYWDADLDFFILFGSLAAVAGNRGQSAYAAANTFMTSVAQRRRDHGKAGSTINPGEIRGIGYVARMGQTLQDDLGTLGYLVTSEQDLHELVAEGILAGDPQSGRCPDVIAGPVDNNPEITPDLIWYPNPLLWHYITYDVTSCAGTSSEDSLPIRERVKLLTDRESVQAAIFEVFVAKLRSKLQLADDDHVAGDTMLIELGVDSLTAVDLRAWFVKELSVDMPVLKIVSGSSIEQLIDEAINKLPATALPGLNGAETPEATEESKPVAEAPKPSIEKALSAIPKSVFSQSPSIRFDLESSHNDSVMSSATSVFSEVASETSPDDVSHDGIELTPQSEVELEFPTPKYERIEKLSSAQLRYWFLVQYMENKCAYNVTLCQKVYGQPRIDDLKAAVRLVANRHDTLRTCYISNPDGEPRQAISPVSRLHLETCVVETDADADVEYAKIRDHVYDLEHGEVARIRMVTLNKDQQYLIVGYHHMCMDAASLHIFMEELEMAYMKRTLPPVSLQYTDYAVAQRTAFERGELISELAYWTSEFPDQPEPIGLLPMAKVRSRPVLKQYELDEVVVRVDAATMQRIRTGCKKQRATPFHFFLAVLRVVLGRMAESDDICIGVADANRLDASTQKMIGFLLNLLPLRFAATEASFAATLKNTRDKAYKALRNSGIPFDKLLEELNVPRSTQHSPLFQVLMDWQPETKDTTTFGPHQSETKALSAGNTPYDLTLLVTESSANNVRLKFRYQTALYDRHGAEVFARSFLKLVRDFAADFDHPTTGTDLYDASDLENALTVGRGRPMRSAWPATLSKHIEQLCSVQPNKVALKDTHHTMTYKEMRTHANHIAARLQESGVRSGSAVTLFQRPTSLWVCCMLAIWKLNAIYVPLDLRTPIARLATMVEDCTPKVILYHDETKDELAGLHYNAARINIDAIDFTRKAPEIPDETRPESPAVILYTSGSTGKPKGIVLRHESLRNQVEGYGSEWGLDAEISLQQGAMTFNHSLDQIFSGLCNGGSVYIVPQALRGDPISLSKLIVAQGITYTKATPAEYSMWLAYGAEHLRAASSWRFAFGGGEHFSSTLAHSFRALRLSQLRLFNSYGPGEITISSHKMEIFYRDNTDSNIYPVGYSLPNYTTYIVDKDRRLVPTGVSGEIVIGGAGPCIGYLDRDALNKEKFVENPFASPDYLQNGWNRAYRTFDRGHLQSDGSLVIEGRLDGDTQVKLRGIRMELEDIENTIIAASEGQLSQVVVSLRQGESQYLVAHAGFSPNFADDKGKYLQALPGKLPLPQYMCPSVMVPLDQFPLNVHGKVDRKAVAALALPQATDSEEQHDLSDAELAMRGIWAQVLDERFTQFADIGRDTNFFLAGGSSILLVKLQALLHQQLGVTVPLIQLVEASTLGEMTATVQATTPSVQIDWAAECSIDELVASTRPSRRLRETRDGLSVVLTGATGFLGSHILKGLCDSSGIAQIHAVAIRPRKGVDHRLGVEHPKLTEYEGNLAEPLLGLSRSVFDDLAANADMIIHCGANRSFWDPYQLLRGTNVESTRSLISMAAGQRIPIHFLSSGATADIQDVPPVDGSDGYVATKWASEQLLANAAKELAIPVTVHRLTQARYPSKPDAALIDELQRMVEELQCVPTGGGWNGTFALMPLADITNAIVHQISDDDAPATDRFHVVAHAASMSVGTDDVIAAVQGLEKYKQLDTLPAVRWLGRAKVLGFKYLVTGQDAVIGRPEQSEESMRSRR